MGTVNWAPIRSRDASLPDNGYENFSSLMLNGFGWVDGMVLCFFYGFVPLLVRVGICCECAKRGKWGLRRLKTDW